MAVTFPSLVLSAAADHSKWRDVLEALVALCGASIGVISLRTLDTAEMSWPADSAATSSAPLIVGIAPEFVASYFEVYHALDSWTKIEEASYPHAPYFMSDYLSLTALKETEFYKGWLEPQGVCECLTAEVYLARSHWVALNLLFDDSVRSRRREVLAHIESALPIMRTGWQLGDRLLSMIYNQVASVRYLEDAPVPCLGLDEEFVVRSINARGVSEFAAHIGLAVAPSVGAQIPLKTTALGPAISRLLADAIGQAGQESVAVVPSLRAGYSLHVTRLAQGEDVVGKKRAHFLVVAKPDAEPAPKAARVPRIWEAPDLTPSQAAVVKWVAEGGVVPDYAAAHGISKKTAYDHLFAARQKLGGISAREIFASHQSMLAIGN